MDESFRDRRKQAMHDGHIWILKGGGIGDSGRWVQEGQCRPPDLTSFDLKHCPRPRSFVLCWEVETSRIRGMNGWSRPILNFSELAGNF